MTVMIPHTKFIIPRTNIKRNAMILIDHLNLGVESAKRVNTVNDGLHVPYGNVQFAECDREYGATNRRSKCNNSKSGCSSSFEPMGDNTKHWPKYDSARDLQAAGTVRDWQLLDSRGRSTDTNAETLTKQKMPVLVALCNQECTQDKNYRGNQKR